MANNRTFKKPEQGQPGFGILNHDVVGLIARRFLSIQEAGRLSQSCQLLWWQVMPVLDVWQVEIFLQAVVEDDRKTVSDLLTINPWLILAEPSKDAVIESRLTWQRFYAENALSMAVKLKQIEMIKILLPYYDQLIQRCKTPEEKEGILNTKSQAMAAWTEYETQQNAAGKPEFVIPDTYKDILQNLINLFSQETFPEGKVSHATEAALTQLFDMLLPEQAVKLEDYFDIELLFYGVCKMYDEQFNVFENWARRDAFCIRVMGLIQSVLSPETAKIMCEGLYYVIKENRPVGAVAASLKLKGGQSYYRPSRDSRSGLGFEYLCAAFACVFIVRGAARWVGRGFGKLMSSKNKIHARLTALQPCLRAHHQAQTCVIL